MLCMLERAHVANKVFHLISQSIHRAAGRLSYTPRGIPEGPNQQGHTFTWTIRGGTKSPSGPVFSSNVR